MAKADKAEGGHLATIRETFESVAVAIVLAFVLRAFVVEAFVIPTGSMAPRLMGQHWQFDCPACGYHYAFGLHQPAGREPDASRRASANQGARPICPNCRREGNFQGKGGYSGDRVLVLKYLYRFREPKPWDVVVFKNPQDNDQNYIKRLIGLPGQMIEIVHGDVYFRDGGEDLDGDGVIDEADFRQADKENKWPWHILRKTHKTQEVMWQVVFDNDYQPDQAVYARWDPTAEWRSPWRPARGSEAWDLHGDGGRRFTVRPSQPRERLEFTPSPEWECFCPNYAYNQRSGRRYDSREEISYDLKLSLQFVPQADDARVGLHLGSFSDHFRGWVGADGVCVLEHAPAGKNGLKEVRRVRIGPLKKGRGHDVALTHVDCRATLWVDDRPVAATTDREYRDDKQKVLAAVTRIRADASGEESLPPPTVAILAEGGEAALRHVRLMRDVYYTSPNARIWKGDSETDLPGYGTTMNPITLRKFLARPDMDEFYVLGDNSPASKDSRMWGKHAKTLREEPAYRNGTVPRYNMIGKAFFVYWPGGFRLTSLEGWRLPIVPNVGRMRLIR